MPILHAIVLGIVQGLSEFLPISSSGHLVLVPWLFGWNDLEDPGVSKAFDVALHIGTLAAVIGYFRVDLVRYVRDGLRAVTNPALRRTPDGRLPWLLVVSAVPAAAVGAVFEKAIEERLGTIALISVSLIVFGGVLWWADRLRGRRGLEDFGLRDALVVGGAQVLALNPGTSRSGITISAARVAGFDRDAAARISFLMSLPVTSGAVVFKVGKLVADGIPDGLLAPMLAGIVAAGVSGWVAVWGTIRLVRTRSFAPFVAYRVVVGAVFLVLVAVR
jgi:undecaprenyl-diphosphatase